MNAKPPEQWDSGPRDLLGLMNAPVTRQARARIWARLHLEITRGRPRRRTSWPPFRSTVVLASVAFWLGPPERAESPSLAAYGVEGRVTSGNRNVRPGRSLDTGRPIVLQNSQGTSRGARIEAEVGYGRARIVAWCDKACSTQTVHVLQSSPQGAVRLQLGGGKLQSEVRPRPGVPYSVDVDGWRIEALGTLFIVEERPEGVWVRLDEGRLRVSKGTFAAAMEAPEERLLENRSARRTKPSEGRAERRPDTPNPHTVVERDLDGRPREPMRAPGELERPPDYGPDRLRGARKGRRQGAKNRDEVVEVAPKYRIPNLDRTLGATQEDHAPPRTPVAGPLGADRPGASVGKNSPGRRDRRAVLDEKLGRLEAAIAAETYPSVLTQAKELLRDPDLGSDRTEVQYWLAEAYRRTGAYEPALLLFRRILKEGQGSPERIEDSAWSVAYCEAQLKRIEAARRSVNAYLKAYPKGRFEPSARRWLRELDLEKDY